MSTIRGEMWTLMGLLLVLMVSGEDVIDVEGLRGKDVLLPCNCFNRNPHKEFRWQMEGKHYVVKYNGTTEDFHNNYTNRASLFLTGNSSNCTILLKNITAADQGMYKCGFKVEDRHTYFRVNLSVFENYSAPQYALPTQTGEYIGSASPSTDNIRTSFRVMPFVLVVVLLSLVLVLVLKEKMGGGNVTTDNEQR